MSKQLCLQYLDARPQFKQQYKQLYTEFPDPNDPLQKDNFNRRYQILSEIVHDTCECQDASFLFSKEELLNRLSYLGSRPICLDTLLKEMENRNEISGINQLNQNSSWAWNLISNYSWKPLSSWAFGWKPQTRYVSLRVFNKKKKLLEEKYDNKIVTEAELKQQIGSSFHDEELNFVLSHLIYKQRAFRFTLKNGVICCKFSSIKPQPPTETEQSVMLMKTTLEKLEQEQLNLDKRIKETQRIALEAKRKSDIKHALECLKRSKKLKEIFLNRVTQIHTLKEILEKIEDAQTTKQILDAYQLGTKTLRITTTENGISPEAIDDVMSELSEVFADHKEIDDAMQIGIDNLVGSTQELEEEFDKELQELMKEENEEKTGNPNFPSVPQETPQRDNIPLSPPKSKESSNQTNEPQVNYA